MTPARAQIQFAPDAGAWITSAAPQLSQQLLAADIPVTGKARKFLVTVSGEVGHASISLLNDDGQEALYIYIQSNSEHVGNLRYTLPVRMSDQEDMRSALLGPRGEARIDLPEGARIRLTIRARELEYQGVDTKALQSELEVRHTLDDGTTIIQQLKIMPERLFDLDGYKRKDTVVEFERKERTSWGKRSRSTVRFELRELRSEDFEGRPGGPPVFVSRS